MTLPWSDRGDLLLISEVHELFRDAVAVLGKCNLDADPAAVVEKSVSQLAFDQPPLMSRPNHQTRGLYYVVLSLFRDANIDIRGSGIGRNYFVDKPNRKLKTAARELGDAQVYRGGGSN